MTRQLILSLSLLAFIACNGNKTKDSEMSSDSNTVQTTSTHFTPGDYFGILPAASGPGIMTDLVLKSDGKYELSMAYLEENGDYTEEGSYTVNEGLITLSRKDSLNDKYFRVQDKAVMMLDSDRRLPEGDIARHYVLSLR